MDNNIYPMQVVLPIQVEFQVDGSATLLRDFEAHGIIVPKGFNFDGASAPRAFWPAIPPFKNTVEESCIHDWLCKNAKNKKDRLFADRLFLKMLLEDPIINNARAILGYAGVRVGAFMGYGVYYKHWSDPIKELVKKVKRQVV
jgi:hypothetical protein